MPPVNQNILELAQYTEFKLTLHQFYKETASITLTLDRLCL